MSIFGKKPDSQPESSPTPTAAPPPPAPTPQPRPQPAPQAPSPKRSFLGEGCKFEGELRGEGSFECGGDFNGTIEIEDDLVISRAGVAQADLKARRITIEGRLEGNATGGEKVEVGPVGHVEGDVRAPAVQFAEGAFFEGNVEMRRSKGNEPAPEVTEQPADREARPDGAAGGGGLESGQGGG